VITYLHVDLVREVLGGVMAGVTYYLLRAERDDASPQ
jgi:hypothetical protein